MSVDYVTLWIVSVFLAAWFAYQIGTARGYRVGRSKGFIRGISEGREQGYTSGFEAAQRTSALYSGGYTAAQPKTRGFMPLFNPKDVTEASWLQNH